MPNLSQYEHADPQADTLLGNNARPASKGQDRDQRDIIEAAEAVLMVMAPLKAGDYWPTQSREKPRQPGMENALVPTPIDEFSFAYLTGRGNDGPHDIDEREAAIPNFRRDALLDAITEVLRFAHDHLREHRPVVENYYLFNEIRLTCRRQLTWLLGKWYELESAERATVGEPAREVA